METQIPLFEAFDTICLEEADIGFFLNAIKHTTCCIASCAHQLEQDPASESGVYTVCGDPNYEAYCDMERHGGGWMLLMKAVPGNTFGWHAEHWTSPTTLNTDNPSPEFDGDAKYPSF